MRKITMAMVQFNSSLQQVPSNIERAISFVEQAASKGADLIVFPELFTTGYDMEVIGDDYDMLGESIDGKTTALFSAAAKKNSINLVIPLPLKKENTLYNSAVIIDRQGNVVGNYDKTHLWQDEKSFFVCGDLYPVFEMDFGKLGVMICYDAGFPEVARMLALRGAELIVVPGAFAAMHKYRWDIYFQARALENSCFVAGINGVGGETDILFGNDKIFGPEGNLLTEGVLNEEEMQIVELDLDQVTACRNNNSYLSQLRKETYFAYQIGLV